MSELLGKAAVGGLSMAVLTLTACTSSGGTGTSKVPAPSTSAPSAAAPAPSTDSASQGAALASSAGAARDKRTVCADLALLEQVNKRFDGVGQDIAKLKSLLDPLQNAADNLARDAPSAVSAAATQYKGVVAVLATYTRKATSVSQLNSESKSDPQLTAALGKLTTSTQAIEKYKTTSC